MTQAVALQKPTSLFPSESEWSMLKEQAGMAVRSGLLPAAIKTAEQAIVIALKGRELGIPPMQAFAHIHIINGKPGISAELMLALIFKNCPGAHVDYLDTSDQACVIEAKRPDGKRAKFSFSIEDAKRASLLSKGTWTQYPGNMLRARAISNMARALFPDAIMGCSYTPEELGAEVDEDGRVIDNQDPPPAADPKPAPVISVVPAPVPAAETPKPTITPKPAVRTRATIGVEIMTAAAVMKLDKAGVEQWALDLYGKPADKMTIQEMESFLETLLREQGRNGVEL